MNSRCPTCGDWRYSEHHRCPPAFRVWCPEDGGTEDDARIFYALDAQEAAEKWADREDCDSADYMIVSGRSTPTVYVRAADGTMSAFEVQGESVPSYSASEVDVPASVPRDAPTGEEPTTCIECGAPKGTVHGPDCGGSNP